MRFRTFAIVAFCLMRRLCKWNHSCGHPFVNSGEIEAHVIGRRELKFTVAWLFQMRPLWRLQPWLIPYWFDQGNISSLSADVVGGLCPSSAWVEPIIAIFERFISVALVYWVVNIGIESSSDVLSRENGYLSAGYRWKETFVNDWFRI